MRFIITLLAAFGLCAISSAQRGAPNFWTPVDKDAVVLPANAERLYEPLEYSAFRLDFAAIKAQLAQAPMQETPEAANHPLTVLIPQADGTLEPFAVVETPVLTPRVQAKYPDIRTFSGTSLTSPGKHVKIHYSPYRGFRAMIRRADKGIEWLEPVAPGQDEYYMVYDRHMLPQGLGVDAPAISTISAEELRAAAPPRPAPQAENRGTAIGGPVRVRVYRFACTTTVQFSQDNGGTVPAVLATVVDFTNNLNGIYESDLDIRLVLVDGIENIIFTDPANNPFGSGYTVENYADGNPGILNQYLGSVDAYDIGHVFARYLGGPNAGVAGGLCCTLSKGAGCSSSSPPYGDYFFGVVGQEIGHQWAAGHTWNHCDANNQYAPESACEPGSGSTIMSYAGLCGNDNVTGGADLYYHPCSIWQINNFVENGIGNTCGQWEDVPNTTPMASAPYSDNFFIPISTPFELTGSATDVDGDALTYTWDEIDVGLYTPLGEAQGSSPLFRSLPPTTNPTRYFPKLLNIITNNSDIRELLPTYSRDLTFCFVVRDNHPGGGGVAYDTVAFRSTDQAGPFVLTYPTAPNITWHVGEYRTVTWDVANTDKAPVNCPTVNLRLSLNGGQTYPVMLAAGVPNTGSYCLKVPDNQTVSGRIRVEAANNIFFDISNYHVKILAPTTPGFGVCTPDLQAQICTPNTFATTVSTTGWSGFSDALTLSASGLPAGAVATFNPPVVQPGADATLTVDFPTNTVAGQYNLDIIAASGGVADTITTQLTVISNDFSAFALQQPADGATSVVQTPILRWNGVVDADTYDVQLANSPSFDAATILASKTNAVVDTFKVPVVLEKAHVYYWRVRAKNACGIQEWSEPFVFATLVDACTVVSANDLPISISPNGTPTIESTINIGSGGTLSDVNVKKVQGFHDYFHDLEAHLIGPDGTDVLLWKDKCSQNVPTFNIGFDDAAVGIFPCPPPNTGIVYNPFGDLSVFNGKNATGAWKLRVKDNQISSGGQITGFELELCSNAALNAPFLVNNNPMAIETGTNLPIGTALLLAQDANNTADQLTYTLITTPTQGRLENNWGGELHPGAQFSQADIDNGAIRYFGYGGLDADHFRFAVTDGEGGFLTGTFVIQPFSVGTHEPAAVLAFDLSPNPANASAVLRFSLALHGDTRVSLTDASGRQLRNWSLAPGASALTLDVHDLPKGVYAVSVQNADGKAARKLVVQ